MKMCIGDVAQCAECLPTCMRPRACSSELKKGVEVYNSYSFDSAFLVLVYYYPLCLSSLVLLRFVHSVLSHAVH